MHLADAFIQSDLHCIQVTVLSLGIEPMILALLALPFELQESFLNEGQFKASFVKKLKLSG